MIKSKKMQDNFPKCVTVIIRNEKGEILMLEHVKCKHKFTFPAGTMEPDEREMKDGYVKTVVREMKEELDLDVNPEHVCCIETTWAYYDRIDGHKLYWEHVCEIIADHYAREVKNMEPEKHPTMKWVSPRYVFLHPQEFTYQTWNVVTTYFDSQWYNGDIKFVPDEEN